MLTLKLFNIGQPIFQTHSLLIPKACKLGEPKKYMLIADLPILSKIFPEDRHHVLHHIVGCTQLVQRAVLVVKPLRENLRFLTISRKTITNVDGFFGRGFPVDKIW